MSDVQDRVASKVEEQRKGEMETPGPGGRLADPQKEAERRRKISEAHKRRRAAKKGQEEPPEETPITETEVAAYGVLGGTLWKLLGPYVRVNPLDSEQQRELGKAMAPLGRKWAPFLDKWSLEFNFVLVVVSLYEQTKQPDQAESPGTENKGGD